MPGPERGLSPEQLSYGPNPLEASAVGPEQPEITTLSEEEEARIDAALRERTPQPPLTDTDVSKLEMHRGRTLTEAEIDDMNAARAAGVHTGIV